MFSIGNLRWSIEQRLCILMNGGTMVTMKLYERWRGSPRRKLKYCLPLFLLLLMVVTTDVLRAQGSFVNAGTLNNMGTFRVKYAATGLPDTIGGTFEYFGGNQTVPAKTYNNLTLSGDSTKTSSGNFSILQTVSVAQDVTMNVSSGTMTLSTSTGRLTENGAVLGNISKTVNFTKTSDTSDVGGIGATILYSGTPLGSTTVKRISGMAPAANAIQRSFTITPSVTTGFAGTLQFKYANDEVPSGFNKNAFELWRSIDGGTTWRRQRSTNNASGMQLSKTGSYLAGMWTAADTLHLLGRKNYEGDPDSIFAVGADSLRSKTNKLLTPFAAQITDVFGNAIKNAKVQLSISNTPSGATGQAITDTLGNTLTNNVMYSDNNGFVKVGMKLGNKRGSYYLTAKVDSISSPQKIFIGYADPAAAALAAVTVPGSDSVRNVLAPLVIAAKGSDSSLVPDVNVKFEIYSSPTGASTQAFVSADTMTGSAGTAQAVLRLGQKAGIYTLKVSSSDIDSSAKYFSILAQPGKAALVLPSASTLIDTIGSTLNQFSYVVTDRDTNGVKGRFISFVTNSRPAAATGDSLFIINSITDSLGRAAARLRLGNKIGQYQVAVSDSGIANSTRNFIATALPGKPMHLNQILASSSVDTIGATLPLFGASITDRASNAISGLPVKFLLSSKPSNSVGAALAIDSLVTDSTGSARTRLVLGNKVGQYSVTVNSPSMKGVDTSFTFTATHGVPMNFTTISGNNQSKPILSSLDSLLKVNLTDRGSNAVANNTVVFTVSGPAGATGYALSNYRTLTDSTGMAATLLSLGQKVGTYKVIATSTLLGVSDTFNIIALHGVASALVYQTGASQSKQILSLLDTSFVVNVRDAGNNSVAGVGVKFAILTKPSGSWGDTLTVDSVGTDSVGNAYTKLKFGSKVGTYTVIATSPSLKDTVRFTGTALVGKPTFLVKQTGDAQVGQIGDVLKPFLVQVQDTGANNIANSLVTFTLIQRPALDTAASVAHDSVRSDASGFASTVFTLGNRPGVYKVRASVPGRIDSTFTAQALFVEGDANHDNQQNIGDLTAIIDHILGKRVLTGYDFIRADMYPVHADGSVGDGKIDIRDALVCLDSLVAGGWDPTRNDVTNSTVISPKINLSVMSTSAPTDGSATVATNIQSAIEMTHIGSRFVLNNTVPIKGLQAAIYLKQPAILDTVDLVFARAQMMTVKVKSVGKIVNVVLYNLNNTPIDTGSTPIFRLPVQLSANSIDSVKVIASVDTNIAQVIPWAAEDIRNEIPSTWMLYQNYPNPFNPTTTIEFDVPEITGSLPRVAVQIFDVLGRKVKTVEKDVKDAGRYKVIWDGTNEDHIRVATGVYFYRVLAGGNYAATKKMLLLK